MAGRKLPSVPLTDQDGKVTPAWEKWLRTVLQRLDRLERTDGDVQSEVPPDGA